MELKKTVKEILKWQRERDYEKKLKRKQAGYHYWVKETEKAAAGTEAVSRKERDFVIYLSEKAKLHRNAVSWIAEFFREHPDCMVIYGDEDVREGGVRRSPWYKPCWSPVLYEECFYFGSMYAVRKSCLSKQEQSQDCIPFREPEEILDKLGALLDKLGAFGKGSVSVQRIPKILSHTADESVQEEFLAVSPASSVKSGKKSVSRNVLEAKVSIIIPSRDNPEVLARCVEPLKPYLREGVAELIVVDNGSNVDNRWKLRSLLSGVGMRYLYEPMEFHFSKMCNLGAKHALGNVLLFLNDDCELLANGSFEEMLRLACQPQTGAVGLKLYYPDSEKIQHDGVCNVLIGPVHKLQFQTDDREYYYGFNRCNRNVLAVTAACMMVERVKFQEAGGFPEELKIAFNDVDFCFSLWELGYHNAVVNRGFAYHHESLSRGTDESWEKQRRLSGELEILYERHPLLRGVDPYYPEQMNISGLDTRVLPGYPFSKNVLQRPEWKQMTTDLEQIKEDECLLIRVESAQPDRLQGYGVVLGSDNARFDKYLLLKAEEEEKLIWSMLLEECYRQDLEENMSDQVNVALCGFEVGREGERLPAGRYRIGMLAVDRTGNARLVNWTTRELVVADFE